MPRKTHTIESLKAEIKKERAAYRKFRSDLFGKLDSVRKEREQWFDKYQEEHKCAQQRGDIIAALETENQKLEQERDNAREENRQLEKERDQARAERGMFQKERDTLRREFESAEKEIAIAKQQVSEAIGRNNAANRTADDYKHQLEAMTADRDLWRRMHQEAKLDPMQVVAEAMTGGPAPAEQKNLHSLCETQLKIARLEIGDWKERTAQETAKNAQLKTEAEDLKKRLAALEHPPGVISFGIPASEIYDLSRWIEEEGIDPGPGTIQRFRDLLACLRGSVLPLEMQLADWKQRAADEAGTVVRLRNEIAETGVRLHNEIAALKRERDECKKQATDSETRFLRVMGDVDSKQLVDGIVAELVRRVSPK